MPFTTGLGNLSIFWEHIIHSCVTKKFFFMIADSNHKLINRQFKQFKVLFDPLECGSSSSCFMIFKLYLNKKIRLKVIPNVWAALSEGSSVGELNYNSNQKKIV